MKWTYFRIKGYFGIKDGLGLDELKIDFSKCKNDVVIIIGKNGSGKSTLQKALSCMPDPSSEFVPNMIAEKEGVLMSKDGVIYHFNITCNIDASGNRKTKCFICKNGIELNPNGNVTSYKDVIFNEFDMDSNYIALTRLASDDRGIADKTPSERKKYVSSRLQSLDTYNSMYKTLSKRSSTFRSHINGLHNKISNIGNIENARLELFSIDDRISKLKMNKENKQMLYAKNQATIQILDPNGSIQNLYNDMSTRFNEVKKSIEYLAPSIESKCNSLGITLAQLDSCIESHQVRLAEIQKQIDDNKSIIRNLISESEDISRSLQLKTQRLDGMRSEYDYNNLIDSINKYSSIVEEQKKILDDSGFGDTIISKEEYIMILQKLKTYRESTLSALSFVSNAEIETVVSFIINGESINKSLDALRNEKDFIEKSISKIKSEMSYYNGLLESVKILGKRPSDCNIDSCPFISKALSDLEQDPENNLSMLSEKLNEANIQLKNMNEQYNRYELMYPLYQNLLVIINDAKANENILSKLPASIIFTDKDEYLKRVLNGNTFNEVEDCDKYIMMADRIDYYNDNKNILSSLIAEMRIYESKNSILLELEKDIGELDAKLKNADIKVKNANDSISFNTNLLNKTNNMLSSLLKIKEEHDTLCKKIEEKNKIKNKFNEIKDNIKKVKCCIDETNIILGQIQSIELELDQIQNTRDELKYKLSVVNEYQAELNSYQDKYDAVEILRKYCSPNTGIQTVFMNIYMNKTLSIANEILSLLFNGELELLPYVISADEFRIPVKHSSGLITDDVSSCSGAQIAMISMATTYSLALQASPKFNIIRMDEIDGALDTDNRAEFPFVIKCMNKAFDIEQAILISHSIEIPMSRVDAILLALPSSTKYDYNNVNVIYNYNNN